LEDDFHLIRDWNRELAAEIYQQQGIGASHRIANNPSGNDRTGSTFF
jgi:hypothetical protein